MYQENNKSVTAGMEMQQVGTVVGAWLHQWYTRMCSWACEANYKTNDQPIHEGVMARVVIIHVVNHFMNTRNYVVFIIPNIVL